MLDVPVWEYRTAHCGVHSVDGIGRGVNGKITGNGIKPAGQISMHEQDLRERIAAVKAGRVSRRTFAHRMIGLGFTVPFASQLLPHAGLAQSPAPIDYKPTRAGGGGALRTMFWQAPTSLNRISLWVPRTRKGRGFFTSRWRPGSPTGTWFRYLLPRFRTSRTAGLPLTACRLSGS
jgi:hypothetical protein